MNSNVEVMCTHSICKIPWQYRAFSDFFKFHYPKTIHRFRPSVKFVEIVFFLFSLMFKPAQYLRYIFLILEASD